MEINKKHWFQYDDSDMYDILSNYPKNKEIIDQCLSKTDGFGNTKLFYIEDQPVIEMFIKSGGNINHLNNENENALFSAEYKKSLCLIKNGIDVNVRNNYGYNAMAEADLDVLRLLVDAGVNIHNKDKNGENVLFIYNDLGRIEYITQMGLKSETDIHGNSLLMSATIKDHDALDYLIDNKIVDLDYINDAGHNALYYNIGPRYTSYSTYLVNKGININNKNAYDGVDVTELCIRQNNPILLNLIYEKRSGYECALLKESFEASCETVKKIKRL